MKNGSRKKKSQTKIVTETCFYCSGQKEISSGYESNGYDTRWISCPFCKGIGTIDTKYKKVRKVIWERV